MADRPIIFSAPMVRALLDGRKTQTRRLIKPQPELNDAGLWRFPPMSHKITRRNWRGFCQTDDEGLRSFILATPHAPYAPGDRLWVREAWSGRYVWRDMRPSQRATCGSPQALEVFHWADGNPDHGDWERPRPSIHMPRWASRLTLTVTDVRVQRLQDISGEDCIAEGACEAAMWPLTDADAEEARQAFRNLWNSLHGPEAWDANPWCCAISFIVCRWNIDSMEAAA